MRENLLEDIFWSRQRKNSEDWKFWKKLKIGTIFIKNIEKMSFKMRKEDFLDFMRRKKFYRIGGVFPIKINFRLMASCTYSGSCN